MVGAPSRPSFMLTDHFGNVVRENDFRGRYQLVYFGFTSCKVVCPRALAKLSGVLGSLDPNMALRVQALYVSVDPERDTPEVMRAYLQDTYPSFLGLTGTEPQIEETKKSFRIFAQRKLDPDDPEGYQIAHTAITYLLNQEGEYLDHYPDVLGDTEIRNRLVRWLA